MIAGALLWSPATQAATATKKGIVIRVGGSSLQMRTKSGATLSFVLSRATKVQRLGRKVPRSAIKAGTPVKITAASIVTGAAARKIEIGVATPSGTFFSPKKSGTVTAVAATTLELATKSRTLTFRLAASTKVERLGARLAPRSIEKGARVKVKFSIDPSGRLVAAKVRIGVPCGTEVLFSRKAKGRVTGLSGGVLTVATGGAKHLVARLTTGTKVRRLGARVPRAAIRTGRTVKLKLALGTTGLVEASSVSIATPTAFGPVYTPKERAIVASVSRRGFIVRELGKSVRAAFRVDARTRVERRGRTAKSRVLRVGEAVNVRFAVRAGGILVAVRVEVGRRAGSNLVFPKTKRGALLSLSARNLVLRTAKGKRLRFAVNRRTFFGRPRATFRRGARVNVTYDPARNSATALVVVRS